VFLWNDQVKAVLDYFILQNVTEMKLEAALDTIRGFLLLYWKQEVTRDFFEWWEGQRAQAEKVGSLPDLRSLEAGKIAISHANAASWWEWDGGSALFIWRWPKKFQAEMRDGLPPRFVGTPPRSKERQRRHTDPEVKRKEKKKIDKRGYIVTKFVGTRPWISKRRTDGRITSDIHLFVDDNRETAATQELAWRAGSRMAETWAWLGLQDAARKRREPSIHLGAWAGSVVHVEDDAVYKLVTQERWDKTKTKIDWIWKEAQEIRAGIKADMGYKTLESYRVT